MNNPEQHPTPLDENEKQRPLKLDYMSIGIEFGVATALGYWLGSWIDEKWNTHPWFAMVLALFGIAAAFKDLWKLSQQYLRERETQRKSDDKRD